jgi:TatD DNase family protein
VALGLHPQLAAERAEEIVEFERHLKDARYVGEVGLDGGPRFYKSMAVQKNVFGRVLDLCAAQGGKILTIHSVRSVTAVLDMLEAKLPPSRAVAVLHWFTGTRAEALRATELGCYFSINSQMLAKPAHRALVAGLPEDRLLTETDGPFVQRSDRPVVPSDVKETVEMLAALRTVSKGEMARTILRNLSILVR